MFYRWDNWLQVTLKVTLTQRLNNTGFFQIVLVFNTFNSNSLYLHKNMRTPTIWGMACPFMEFSLLLKYKYHPPKCSCLKSLNFRKTQVVLLARQQTYNQFHIMKDWKREYNIWSQSFITWFTILHKATIHVIGNQNNLNLQELFPVYSLEYHVFKKNKTKEN